MQSRGAGYALTDCCEVLLYALDTDRIENIASKSSSIIAYVSVAAEKSLPSLCLATAVSLAPLF
jgi:hypothetical protein